MSSDQPEDPPLPPIYRLSQELIDEIIDTLNFFAEQKWWAYRWDYLANCALVCRAFAPRAQMHLFTPISLPGLPASRWVLEEDWSRVSALLEIVDNNPTIAKHIRELSLYLPQGNPSWLYRRPEMLTLMEKINSTDPKFPLRNLRLSSSPRLSPFKTAAYDSEFPHLHRFFKQAIVPYITILHIGYIMGLPVELVTMCTHLQDLKVINATFTFREPDAFEFLDEDTHQPLSFTMDWNRRPKIQSLEYKLLGDDYDIGPDTSLPRLLTDPSFLDFSALRFLTTYTDEPVRNLSLAQRVIDASEGAIVDVMIEMCNYQVTRDSVPSTFLDFNHSKLEGLSYIAFFQPAAQNPDLPLPLPLPLDTTGSKVGGITETCKMLKTIASTSPSSGPALSYLRAFDLILTVHHQAEEDFLHDKDWETFGSEVRRIASLSRSVGGQRGEGGKVKLELWLNMHYHAPPVNENNRDDERYAMRLLERLINERLGSLKDCECVAWQKPSVDVIHS